MQNKFFFFIIAFLGLKWRKRLAKFILHFRNKKTVHLVHHKTFNAGITESLFNSFCITIFYFSQNNLILYQTQPTPDRFKRKTDQLYGPNKLFCCYTVFHLQTEFFLSIIIFFNITQWAPPVLRFFQSWDWDNFLFVVTCLKASVTH